MLEARRMDIVAEATPFQTIADMEGYGESGPAALLQLSLQAVGEDVQGQVGKAASHVGRAMSLVTFLRATRHHAQNGRCYYPRDLIEASGVSLSKLMKGEPSKELSE